LHIVKKYNYIKNIVGNVDAENMLNKWIYNLKNNVKRIEKLKEYHSIYASYSFSDKTLKYYMTNDYNKINSSELNEEKKKVIIKEFKIMMYKEFERIVNLYVDRREISNGFYIDDVIYGRNPKYNGFYSDIMDIFAEEEVCNVCNVNDSIKVYVDEENKYYINSNHISKRNSEVLGYVTILKIALDRKMLYYSINNPKKYSKKMIDKFNTRFDYVYSKIEDYMLKERDLFTTIERYLNHIRNKVNEGNNLIYHKDLNKILTMMSSDNNMPNIEKYLLKEV